MCFLPSTSSKLLEDRIDSTTTSWYPRLLFTYNCTMGKRKDDGADHAAAVPRFPFHARTVEECLAELGCPENLVRVGLTSTESLARLEKYGRNQFTQKKKVTLCERIWHHVANVLVGVLVVVAVVSVIRAATSTTADNIVSNALQAVLIVVVIT